MTPRANRCHSSSIADNVSTLRSKGLLHWWLSSTACSSRGGRWKEHGFVDALSDKFRVICVDSLGHGLSDKPVDPALYEQESRSGDIVAVIDDLGYDRAHLIRYSMGGWISVGVAKHCRERLASLTIGGRDIVDGAKTAFPAGPISFEQLLGTRG